MNQKRKLIIAIDGPAGSGKSTVSRRVAQRLGYRYVDTGAMYRALAWKALQQHVALDDPDAVAKMASAAKIELRCDPQQFQIAVDGSDVTTAIRAPEVSDAASRISTIASLRAELVAQQQRLGKGGAVVMEGRDIGTVVFPQAGVKIFLDANPETRAERRHDQQLTEGRAADRRRTMEAVKRRDHRDASRSASPMVAAKDAVHLDTTHLSINKVVERILALVESKLKQNHE